MSENNQEVQADDLVENMETESTQSSESNQYAGKKWRVVFG